MIGCFVRLGVGTFAKFKKSVTNLFIGKAPGSRSLPQYRVCEIVGVVDYKYSYAFGEFQTKKALMLRIGHNQRVWRMNVISNHRCRNCVSWFFHDSYSYSRRECFSFTPTELEEQLPAR